MKTVSSEILHKNPWWEYKHDEYELPGGQIGNYYYAETRGASMVIPRLPDGRYFLVKQFRYLAQRDSWEFPGGGLKAGQTPEDVAIAELSEEAGLGSQSLVFLGQGEPSNGFIKDKTHFWLAETALLGSNNPDMTEVFTETKAVTAAELEAMVLTGEIWCGQTITAWCLAKLRGLV